MGVAATPEIGHVINHGFFQEGELPAPTDFGESNPESLGGGA